MNFTTRFSDKVENYIRYRPSYPQEVLDVLAQTFSLAPGSAIADIGAGTGIFTKLLLERDYQVWAVEPNEPMRQAATQLLSGYANFTSVAAPAEATTLATSSVALITVAQAFHWFNRAAVRPEFKRILQSGGGVALIWNERLTTGSPFLAAYEQLLIEYGTDYQEVNHTNIDETTIRDFFQTRVTQESFPNQQLFDYQGLEGRLLSSSYVPTRDQPNYQPMLVRLKEIFESYQQNGLVAFDYECKLYYGLW